MNAAAATTTTTTTASTTTKKKQLEKTKGGSIEQQKIIMTGDDDERRSGHPSRCPFFKTRLVCSRLMMMTIYSFSLSLFSQSMCVMKNTARRGSMDFLSGGGGTVRSGIVSARARAPFTIDDLAPARL